MKSLRNPEDVYQEILCKFIINLPQEELKPHRLWFHYEKAFFYFLDHEKHIHNRNNKNKNNNTSTSDSEQMVAFIKSLNNYAPKAYKVDPGKLYDMTNFHRSSIPAYGTILLNQKRDKVVCIVCPNIYRMSFPKGKIDEGETSLTCAIRECWQEIGVDVTDKIHPQHFIQVEGEQKSTTFFIVYDVKQESTTFRIQSKTQVEKVVWISIEDARRERMLNKVSSRALEKLVTFLEQDRNDKSRTTIFTEALINNSLPAGAILQNPFLNFQFDRQKLLNIFRV